VQAEWVKLRPELRVSAPRLLAAVDRLIVTRRGKAPPTGEADTASEADTAGEAEGHEDDGNPWRHIKDAPTFLAEPQPEFEGLAKDLLAPGAITMLAAPRGLGKTHLAHAVGVALATGGIFRGERVKAVKVLLLDRDNPEYLIRQRLQAWGAATAKNLHILTRQHAPSLKKQDAWAQFPVKGYQALIVDAVGSFTEGITEKEGRQTTEVLATIVDSARKDLAILLLQNATKDGLNFKGREEWADRVDVIFEQRDATDFVPSLKRPWWEELPEAHEGAWAARAARRKGRTDFRLAFIPSKYRLGPEPDPFCIELTLCPNDPWTVEDVTHKLQQAGERAKAQAEQEQAQKCEEAAQALAELVRDRQKADKPLGKTEAESFLCEVYDLKRQEARDLITAQKNVLWTMIPLPHVRGKPVALFPINKSNPTVQDNDENARAREAASHNGFRSTLSANRPQQGRQKHQPANPCGTDTPEGGDFRQNEEVLEDPSSAEQSNGHHPTTLGEYEELIL
jgi:hypothetical protein